MLALIVSTLIIIVIQIMLVKSNRYGDISVNVLLSSLLLIIFSSSLMMATAVIAAINMFLYQFPIQSES